MLLESVPGANPNSYTSILDICESNIKENLLQAIKEMAELRKNGEPISALREKREMLRKQVKSSLSECKVGDRIVFEVPENLKVVAKFIITEALASSYELASSIVSITTYDSNIESSCGEYRDVDVQELYKPVDGKGNEEISNVISEKSFLLVDETILAREKSDKLRSAFSKAVKDIRQPENSHAMAA
ncbi:MAG: hypothetical protein N4A38_00850 [Candidatus Gracilibacteria bacterium]|nr:hypothetical protein [Candidatus Gracilibacteria bacterium]